MAVKQVGDENFRISRELIDGIVLVDKDAIAAGIKVFTFLHLSYAILFDNV